MYMGGQLDILVYTFVNQKTMERGLFVVECIKQRMGLGEIRGLIPFS